MKMIKTYTLQKLVKMTGVMSVSCRSTDLNVFQMTSNSNGVSSDDFGLLKFP